jgi:hypothetical protein
VESITLLLRPTTIGIWPGRSAMAATRVSVKIEC